MTSFSKSFQLSPLENVSIFEEDGLRRKTCLATGRLGKPQSPLVHQGVLDVEVVLIMEDCDLLFTRLSVGVLVLILAVRAAWGDGDG